ncbi:MAG: glycosyltransferase family 4 protein [Actinomycetota bacterium]|nr:glycosyltransferase family 4 protein [Actinomycetota bacterium]
MTPSPEPPGAGGTALEYSEVAFVVAHDDMPWSARDPEIRGLGGTETALIRVAAGLAELGYPVTVYANVTVEERIDSVAYCRRDRFDAAKPRAAVVSSRAPELFAERPAARKAVLWVHDPDAGKELTPERAQNIDHIVGLSAWHRQNLRMHHPFAADKVICIGHGFDRAYFAETRAREPRVVSTCQPERGVDVLLELWPAVRSRVPEAELVCCHSPYYDFVDGWNERVAPHRRQLSVLARQPGVRLLGPLPRAQLAQLLLGSRVYAHPSWHTPLGRRFQETFCISALEAQAAGLWTVASAWGALPETVRVGALIDGSDAPGAAWRKAFVEQIVAGLIDRATQQRAVTAGPRAVRGESWEEATRAFAGLIRDARPAREVEALTSRRV